MSITNVPKGPAVDLQKLAADGAILSLWKLKHDTFEISKKLCLPQGQVANRLAWLRDRCAR